MPLRCEDATDSRAGSGPRASSARLSARLSVISLVIVVLGLAGVAVASTLTTGEVGPSLRLTANGRLLHPAGRLTTVGNFPTGSAVAAGGHALWVTDCGHGEDDVKVVNLSSGKVIQTLPLPGCYGGVTLAPDGGTAYVGGLPKGSSPTEGPTKGDQGDVVHVFTVNPRTGTGTERSPIGLPATTGGGGRVNSLPPVSGVGTAQPEGIAVSPNGRYLVVALNAADQAVVVDLHTGTQHLVSAGSYPNGVVFDRGGSAYVSNEYSGTVSVIDPDEREGDRDDQRSRRQPRRPRKPPGGDGRGPEAGRHLRRGDEPGPRRGHQHRRQDRVEAHLRRSAAGARDGTGQARDLPRRCHALRRRFRGGRGRRDLALEASRGEVTAQAACVSAAVGQVDHDVQRQAQAARQTSGGPDTTAGCSPSSIVTCACARRGVA